MKSAGPSRKKSGSSWKRKSENTRHRTEWCADADKYRYEMWKRKQIHKDGGKMYRTKILFKKLGKMEKAPFGRS